MAKKKKTQKQPNVVIKFNSSESANLFYDELQKQFSEVNSGIHDNTVKLWIPAKYVDQIKELSSRSLFRRTGFSNYT